MRNLNACTITKRRSIILTGHLRPAFLATATAAVITIFFPSHSAVAGPIEITGSVNVQYSSSTDKDGNTSYGFASASGNLGINVPVIPVSALASAQPEFWTSPLTWNGAPIFVAVDAINVNDYVGGVLSSFGLSYLSLTNDTVNTLVNSGPTEQSFGIPGLSVESYIVPGVDASLGVSANLKYDVTIPTGANVLMDQPTVVVQSLFVESGAILTGNGGFTIRTDLTNYGTVYSLGGTIQGNFLNATLGPRVAYADVTSSVSVQGSFNNTGTIDIDSAGSLNLSQTSSNNGTINLYGGSLGTPNTFTNNASFHWYGGELPPSFSNSISGSLIIDFPNAATPTISSLTNAAGGTMDIQSDGTVTGNGGGGSIVNSGLLRKIAGSGIFTIARINFATTGAIEVDSGVLESQTVFAYYGFGFYHDDFHCSGSTFQFANGGRMLVDGNGSAYFDKTTTGGGNGVLELNIGAQPESSSTASPVLDFTGFSAVLLSGGSINTNNNGVGITNAGNFRWTGGSIAGLANAGSIRIPAGATPSVSALTNAADGTINLESDGTITGNGGGGSLVNNGLLWKSAGTGTFTIERTDFATSGAVEVDNGVLEAQTAFVYYGFGFYHDDFHCSGSTFQFANGGRMLVDGNGSAYFDKTTTGGGNGVLELNIGAQPENSSTTSPVMNFTGSSTVLLSGGSISTNKNGLSITNAGNFQWTGGTINGLSNTGTISIPANTAPFISSLTNQSGGLIEVQADGAMAGNGTLSNAGTIKKTAGAGTFVIASGVRLTNAGTIEVDSGTLEFDGGFTQTAGITALAGGNLSGSLNFLGGLLMGSGTINGTVYNNGATVSPGNSPGTITIVGDYHQDFSGTLMIEMAGSGNGQYDVLDVNGAAYLDGTLELSFINGFDPSVGDTFAVLNFDSYGGHFSSIQVFGAPADLFTSTYGNSGLILTAVVVPEPTSLGLTTFAVLGLLEHRRRRIGQPAYVSA